MIRKRQRRTQRGVPKARRTTTHPYRFPQDPGEYAMAEDHWLGIWQAINPTWREAYGWRQPWFPPDGLMDGNPIFTAYSPRLKKAIRVIQHPPTGDQCELQWWTDTFGGERGEPDTILELVIACAVSAEACAIATDLMTAWLRTEHGFDCSYTGVADRTSLSPNHCGYPSWSENDSGRNGSG